MTDTPIIKYEHDVSNAFNLFCNPSGALTWPSDKISKTTGAVKHGGANRTFVMLEGVATLSNTDWKSLYDLLVATTTFGSTYPRVVYTYVAGSIVNIKAKVTLFKWQHLNNDEVQVTMRFEERK